MQGEHSNSSPFPIHAGVRQGCVLSPRLFCSVLQWGMLAWRQNAETRKCGFDLGDNMAFLLDLRFADDILLLARTAAEAMALLDDLVHKLPNIGLQLNTGKTVILTSEVQPPSFLHTDNEGKLRVLQQQEAHKWLGCMISAAGSKNMHSDLQHHLQAASRAFHANKWILCDKGVSVLHRLRYFEKVISPVACFGASHRAIHKDDLAKLNVEYRRLLRMVVGPPADTNWASPWHEILHGWNNKVRVLSDYAGLKPWSVTCVEAVWKFASYVATLPPERWTRRILHWNIRGRRTRGRPAYTWDQRWKDIVFGKALTTGLWRLLSMVIGRGSQRILCFSRCTHKNMGWKVRVSTLEICLLHHESPPGTMGSPNAAMATVWKRTCWTSSNANNALGKQIRTVFPTQALVRLERHGCKRGAMDGGGGRFCKVLYSVAVFFSHLFSHWFAP